LERSASASLTGTNVLIATRSIHSSRVTCDASFSLPLPTPALGMMTSSGTPSTAAISCATLIVRRIERQDRDIAAKRSQLIGRAG
jgi:hypothetical protein